MKTVLIADDSLFMRTYLKDMLIENRFRVVTEAKDGVEAFSKYKKYSPDFVLLDLTMPKENGIDALIKIREFDPKANVIMCSAIGQQSFILDALKLGAKDFIVKPFFERLIPLLRHYR